MALTLVVCIQFSFGVFLTKSAFCHVGCGFLVLYVTQVGHQGYLKENFMAHLRHLCMYQYIIM